MQGHLVKPERIRIVYIAGNDSKIVTEVINFLNNLGIKSVSGKRSTTGIASDWHTLADLYNQNMQALLKCDLLIALLDGNISEIADICVEMGLGYAYGIPVLGLCTSSELRASPMLVGMCRGDDQLAYDVAELKELVLEQIAITNSALENASDR